MSDSTPANMADSKISAATLNKLELLFSYRHKASRGANVATMPFSSGGSPNYAHICLLRYEVWSGFGKASEVSEHPVEVLYGWWKTFLSGAFWFCFILICPHRF